MLVLNKSMFGLMQFRGEADAIDENRRQWRLHYCGTCKTLGRRYGQRSRLLLNHDAVFLAELLSALGSGPEWNSAYVSWNCMRLPAPEEMPVVLRYAAAANVLLSEYKVADHEADSGRMRWTWAKRFLSHSFRKARMDLAALGFPLDECERILNRQAELEAQRSDADRAAGPTAEATSLVFRFGGRIAGLEARADALASIGNRFGHLIYLLDAWEDFERDRLIGAFNALRSSGVDKAWAERRIREEALELDTALAAVGAPREFRMRLRANVEARLGTSFPIVHACAKRPPQTPRERWRAAIEKAREWETPPWIFAAVLATAFLFPGQARMARSSSECLSLGLNLMAFGGLLATVQAGDAKPGCMRSAYNSSCGQCCGDCSVDCCCDGCAEGCCSVCDC